MGPGWGQGWGQTPNLFQLRVSMGSGLESGPACVSRFRALTPNFHGALTPVFLLQIPTTARHPDHLRVSEPVDLRLHAGRVEHQRERPVAAVGIGAAQRGHVDHAHALAALAALHQRAHAREQLAARQELARGLRAVVAEGKEVLADRRIDVIHGRAILAARRAAALRAYDFFSASRRCVGRQRHHGFPRIPRLLQSLSPLELAYCAGVLLLNFSLRGALGFGGALGLPLLALAIPVKILAPAWSLVGIVSSAAIAGRGRRHVDWREFAGLLPGCAAGILAGLFIFKALDTATLARALGAFIIAYATYSWWLGSKGAGTKPPLKPAILRPAAAVMSGIVGTVRAKSNRGRAWRSSLQFLPGLFLHPAPRLPRPRVPRQRRHADFGL
jgi:hypothetical protein